MKILAIDTTSGACSAALYDQGAVCERFFRAERDHTRRLLPMVDEVLAEAGIALSQVDALAVSRGPGSFTGLRIAISFAQGLAFASDKPVIPVSSLAALAAGAVREHEHWKNAPVLAALDARMQEVYWGVYRSDVPHDSLLPEAVSSPEAVVEQLQAAGLVGSGAPLYAAGPGLHYPALGALENVETVLASDIQARDIAELAAGLWARNEAVSADQLEPIYLRNEVTWKKRERIRAR
ncbi:tRNA (adenosine(37)-N6)-threonylcarbamoyltransferase complex dimerization subunit type 1 TsaB [Microbulbifer sp. SA54]|uniref:tRNA (adenosine(37)-N6)-threonylcarbamoyltransferase complex dimerization subunit type 1 TsaB n=1 Tax=Microbulbifer sp. SA54 TaxID=3401577 RepID=UPI003AAF3FF1